MSKFISIGYAYRSKKNRANVVFRLYLVKDEGRRSFYAPTHIEVSKSFYNEYQKVTRAFTDNAKAKKQKELNDLLFSIQPIIEKKVNAETKPITAEWFQDVIHEYYNPKDETANAVPTKLIPFIDFFLTDRTATDNDVRAENILTITEGTIKAYEAVKEKLKVFQREKRKTYRISDIDIQFLKEFQAWSIKKGYANTVINKNVSQIKTFCSEAKNHDIEIDERIFGFVGLGKSMDEEKQQVPNQTLSFKDLDILQSLNLDERLDDVRDWLILSCYTGQRISDFRRFKSSMIIDKGAFRVLSIKQQKTKKTVTIPLMPIVESILAKRGGEFPGVISDQRYNDYIKEVCEIADFNEMMLGKVMKNTEKGKRGVIDYYPRWMLITSHIGRRSFATNYYGVMHTAKLKDITGHSTESMLLTYIGKKSDEQQTAIDAVEYNNMINVK